MATAPAIRVEKLSKRYQLGAAQAAGGLRHRLEHAAGAPLRTARRLFRARSAAATPAPVSPDEFWALDDVSFDVHPGDVLGIVGRNGAGKSTLLKILSRITEPTTGRVEIEGRLASLLEVGTGFHPELTGRENIFLNGAILGMTQREIRRRFDEIVAFAEVDKFLDTPVKRYSSGMYVRLAFSVAAHLEAEVLVIDEVLAVGDAAFQRRCLSKMHEVATGGRTVLFVSHNLSAVAGLCTTAIHLEAGRCVRVGSPAEIIDAYLSSVSALPTNTRRADTRPGGGEYRFDLVRPAKPMFLPDETKVFEFRIARTGGPIVSMFFSLEIRDLHQVLVAKCDSRLVGAWESDFEQITGEVVVDSPWLKPGAYSVDAFILANGIVDKFEDACRFEVSAILPYSHSASEEAIQGSVVLSRFAWNFLETRR